MAESPREEPPKNSQTPVPSNWLAALLSSPPAPEIGRHSHAALSSEVEQELAALMEQRERALLTKLKTRANRIVNIPSDSVVNRVLTLANHQLIELFPELVNKEYFDAQIGASDRGRLEDALKKGEDQPEDYKALYDDSAYVVLLRAVAERMGTGAQQAVRLGSEHALSAFDRGMDGLCEQISLPGGQALRYTDPRAAVFNDENVARQFMQDVQLMRETAREMLMGALDKKPDGPNGGRAL